MTTIETYHETLAAALDAVERWAGENRAVINVGFAAPDAWKERFSVGYCIYAGCSARESFELLSYKGKETRKWLHINLYRLESGLYELNCYIL